MSTRAKAYNRAPGAGFARSGERQNAPRVSSPSITPAQASSPRRSNDLADDSARRLPNRRNVKRKDDDELLELGERLASVQPKLISMLRWVDEVRDLVAMEVRRRGSWPEDTAEWTWRDAQLIAPRENALSVRLKLALPIFGLWTPLRPATRASIQFATRYCRSRRARAKAVLSEKWRARFGRANGVDEAFGEFANRLCNIKFPKEWADHLTAV
jgi:hypothetical protein